MPPACARARGGSVRGHLGCAVGTGRTDVPQGPLALDARTWHMGCWHWTYVRDVAKRGRSWLEIDRRGRRYLKE